MYAVCAVPLAYVYMHMLLWVCRYMYNIINMHACRYALPTFKVNRQFHIGWYNMQSLFFRFGLKKNIDNGNGAF